MDGNAVVKQLHPTLKACGCGFVGTKTEFMNHMEAKERLAIFMRQTDQFWKEHGEIPLNEDGTSGDGRRIIEVDFSNIETAVMRGLDDAR